MTRSTKAEKAKQLNAAHRLLQRGMALPDAAERLSQKFDLSERQAYRYLEAAAQLERPVEVTEATIPVTLKLRPTPCVSCACRHARRFCRMETRPADYRLCVPLFVLWLLCRLAKSRIAQVLWRSRLAQLHCFAEGELAKLPLDLSARIVSCATPCCVCVLAGPHASRRAVGIGLGRRAIFGLLDNRLAAAESVDACQRSAQPFLGDPWV